MKDQIAKLLPRALKNTIKKLVYRKYGSTSRLSTSLSDNQVYPNFCLRASTDLKHFSNFRRNIVYKQILEHVTFELGQEYLDEIPKNLLMHIEKFKKNDDWGNPELFQYPKIGEVSPSTLRYVKVLGDLLKLFGDMEEYKVAEIGVGYGGQCRIINSICNPQSYTLIDLKPVLMLTQRYLDNYILKSTLDFKTMNELYPKEYDLVISNYAFTELPRAVQDVYLQKVILNSKRGYITYNEITPTHFNSYKRDELIAKISGAQIIDEKPLTNDKNCIIVWGSQTL